MIKVISDITILASAAFILGIATKGAIYLFGLGYNLF